jgi:DNA-binding CsgD family transcriptional regulator
MESSPRPAPFAIAQDALLVGRSSELDLLRAQLEQACQGLPRLTLVLGPPGIGKTALVRRFLQDVSGARILRTSGDELEARLPYGVIEQLCHDLDGADQAGERDPLTVGAVLLRVLSELQDSGPVIMVVDDAHWADTPSLQALTFMLRRLHADRVLCVMAARDDATNLPEGLCRLVASERGVALYLDGLNPKELVELAAGLGVKALPRRAAMRLHAHTGGNPLYARTLLQQLSPDVLSSCEDPLPAPRSFGLLVVARLAACSVETERLVTAAALLGQRCPLGLAARVAELDNPLPALEEAVGAKFLSDPHTPGVLEVVFAHPLVRAAVYHDLGPARRARLHARAAELVDPPASLDHRVSAVVEPDVWLAADLAAYAAQEVSCGAFASAAAHLESAARLSSDPTMSERLLLDSMEALLRGGEIAQATARAPQVAALPASARQLATLGHLAFLTGRHRHAEHLLVAAWERCDGKREPELAAQTGVLLAQLLLAQTRSAEAVIWAQRVRDLRTSNTLANALAVGVLVAGLALAGRAPEGLAMVTAQPDGVADLPPEDLEGIAARGFVRLWTDDLLGAHADLSAIAYAGGSWRPFRVQVVSLAYLAETEYRLGRWDDSLAHAARAVSLAKDTDYLWLATLAYTMSVPVLAARGEWEAADAHARAAARAAARQDVASAVAYAATAAAFVASARADPARVVETMAPILELRHRDGADEPGVLPWRELYIDALIDLDLVDEAEAVLCSFEALAAARERRSSLAHAARARGVVEAAKGNCNLAKAAFEAGLRYLRGMDTPFSRAVLDDAYGRFLRRTGERRAAAARLGAAREVYLRLGAQPFVERCEREMTAWGLKPAVRRTETTPRLTPHETAVAQLVAKGLANRRIAAELTVSAKTVEYHLGNIYAKLGLSSRTQLATRLGSTTG